MNEQIHSAADFWAYYGEVVAAGGPDAQAVLRGLRRTIEKEDGLPVSWQRAFYLASVEPGKLRRAETF